MCISPKMAINLKSPAQLKVRGASDQVFQSILKNSNDQVELLQQQRLQGFLDQQPAFEETTEIQQLRYPQHLLQFKQTLRHLLPGQRLKIISKSPIIIDDLAAACRILNLPVKTLRFRKQSFLYATQITGASVYPFQKQAIKIANVMDKRSA